jgi:hypothetical protein
LKWTEVLNGREWASVVWLVIFLMWVVSRRDTRGHLMTIVRVPLSKAVFPRAALMLAYITGVVFAASRVGLWEARLIGATLAWVAASAAAGFFKVLEIPQDRHYFHTAVERGVAITILIDAYINLFVAPFWIEIWLLPAIALVYMLKAVGEAKDEFKETRGCFNAMAGLIGVGLLAFGTVHWVSAISVPNLPRLGTSLILPMWLNLALIPLSYIIAVQLVYQSAFVDVESAPNATPASRRRAKWALLLSVGLRAHALGGFGRPWPYRLNAATTLADARRVARELRAERDRLAAAS